MSFVLFDLRFNCNYEVNVQSLSQGSVNGPAVYVSFPTPSCHDVIVRGNTRPDCPTNGMRLTAVNFDLAACRMFVVYAVMYGNE